MSQTPNIRAKIETYRQKLTAVLSGAETVKRLNKFNWLCHEITTDVIRHIHKLLCNGTNIAGGALYTQNPILNQLTKLKI